MEHYQDALHDRVADAIRDGLDADLPDHQCAAAANAVIDALDLIEERMPVYPPGRRQDGPFLRPGTMPTGYRWRAVGGYHEVEL